MTLQTSDTLTTPTRLSDNKVPVNFDTHVTSQNTHAPLSLSQRVIRKVRQTPFGTVKSRIEAIHLSKNGAGFANISVTQDQESRDLHTALVQAKADWMTCLSAWALFLDYSCLEDTANVSPWLEIVAEVERNL